MKNLIGTIEVEIGYKNIGCSPDVQEKIVNNIFREHKDKIIIDLEKQGLYDISFRKSRAFGMTGYNFYSSGVFPIFSNIDYFIEITTSGKVTIHRNINEKVVKIY